MHPPSIPSHDYVFGYEEENGELVRQKNNEKLHTGTKNDTVGPGEYDISRTIGGKKGGPTWHPPRQIKKSALSVNKTVALADQATTDTPGPGYYQADRTDLFPIYKYKQSSAFASKVDRQGQRMRNSLQNLGGAITHSFGAQGKNKSLGHGI